MELKCPFFAKIFIKNLHIHFINIALKWFETTKTLMQIQLGMKIYIK